MIAAVIFDLDGTLVQTEQLKALSYARATVELRPHGLNEADVVAAFTEVVGLSRQAVATALLQRFNLEASVVERMAECGVMTPWQAFVQIRLPIYQALLADPELLRRYAWPHTTALLREARQHRCRTALATMSYCAQVRKILAVLGLSDAFDFIATREDVEHGKPDPEIYALVAHQLAVTPSECLVIEDSPAGVEAALAAGMNVIAVTTPLTRQQFRDTDLLSRCWVVDDPVTLPDVVRRRVAVHQREAHGGASWKWE
jgi:beta-phosphoglucomutase